MSVNYVKIFNFFDFYRPSLSTSPTLVVPSSMSDNTTIFISTPSMSSASTSPPHYSNDNSPVLVPPHMLTYTPPNYSHALILSLRGTLDTRTPYAPSTHHTNSLQHPPTPNSTKLVYALPTTKAPKFAFLPQMWPSWSFSSTDFNLITRTKLCFTPFFVVRPSQCFWYSCHQNFFHVSHVIVLSEWWWIIAFVYFLLPRTHASRSARFLLQNNHAH